MYLKFARNQNFRTCRTIYSFLREAPAARSTAKARRGRMPILTGLIKLNNGTSTQIISKKSTYFLFVIPFSWPAGTSALARFANERAPPLAFFQFTYCVLANTKLCLKE